MSASRERALSKRPTPVCVRAQVRNGVEDLDFWGRGQVFRALKLRGHRAGGGGGGSRLIDLE